MSIELTPRSSGSPILLKIVSENQFSGKTYFYTIGPWSADLSSEWTLLGAPPSQPPFDPSCNKHGNISNHQKYWGLMTLRQVKSVPKFHFKFLIGHRIANLLSHPRCVVINFASFGIAVTRIQSSMRRNQLTFLVQSSDLTSWKCSKPGKSLRQSPASSVARVDHWRGHSSRPSKEVGGEYLLQVGDPSG